MSETIEIPDNDDELDFAELMQGVKPMHSSRANLQKPKPKDPSLNYRRMMAMREEERTIDGLSSDVAELVESEEELIFATPGIQISLLKRLRQGHLPWEQGLDLHGFTVDQARDELSRFIREALRQNIRSVLVVHGKAFSQAGQSAILKSYVNDWLKQMPGVLAFTSALARDGGTGALYVLLKRQDRTQSARQQR
ncbi:Smr/MutS family protein [Nitrincola tapanii]|uniref:DNA mismatch repair protein MutS n=1 Tax=Nitrincola tapanii TaxID=1708751 RepID=A0A5A9W6U1_9GAMM|nr:Smr/MutS family protein [Nitrincola tapanii]KAA0875838.1 DNA mismatch repair protein MutS [Nitrincola tapanii]